jgi:uncharacterized protein (DUF3084 family)
MDNLSDVQLRELLVSDDDPLPHAWTRKQILAVLDGRKVEQVEAANKEAEDAKKEAEDAKKEAEDAKKEAEDAKKRADSAEKRADSAEKRADSAESKNRILKYVWLMRSRCALQHLRLCSFR